MVVRVTRTRFFFVSLYDRQPCISVHVSLVQKKRVIRNTRLFLSYENKTDYKTATRDNVWLWGVPLAILDTKEKAKLNLL